MACWVLSECGLRPLPIVLPRPTRARLLSNPNKLLSRSLSSRGSVQRIDPGRQICLGRRSTKVSATLWVAPVEEKREERRSVGGGSSTSSFGGEGEGEFDPGMPPPFRLAEIRAAIPKHCWVKDPWRSMSYVVRDVVAVLGMAAAAAYLNSWIVWPLYWVAQGTMFWALFVLGHDWRISHRTHHQNHGHVEHDESWHPLSEKIFRNLDFVSRMLRFTVPLPMLAYPLYLFVRTPGKKGSHFHPDSDLFLPNEKKDVLTSTVCWTTMATLLAGLTYVMGPMQMLKLYFVPYWIFVMWLDFVTYLHHHGHNDKLPWYRGKEWSYLRGGLTTLDRDYGWINNIHHDIGTHVIHHLFPQIAHYNLTEATEAARPVLGKYYREPEKSGPLPFHLLGDLIRSLRYDHFVSDTGDIVYYETDPQLNGASPPEK